MLFWRHDGGDSVTTQIVDAVDLQVAPTLALDEDAGEVAFAWSALRDVNATLAGTVRDLLDAMLALAEDNTMEADWQLWFTAAQLDEQTTFARQLLEKREAQQAEMQEVQAAVRPLVH